MEVRYTAKLFILMEGVWLWRIKWGRSITQPSAWL